MSKTLYIHGFASSGQSPKSADLMHILEQPVIAPDLTHQPLQDLASLERLLLQEDISVVVGSSLGGFYAYALFLKHHQKTILINPSLRPYDTLTDQLGQVKSFKHGADFEWTMQQINELQKISEDMTKMRQDSQIDLSKILVLLAQNDERLNYQEAAQLFEGAKIIIDPQQDHRFSDLWRYMAAIQRL